MREHVRIICFFRSDFSLSDSFSASDVLSSLSQLLLNAKSLEASGNEAGSGMYHVYSKANHSCAASAMAGVGSKEVGYELQLRAQVEIKKVTQMLLSQRQMNFELSFPRVTK
jgi:hypothetical protein